ncbi:hypothetical protein [Sporomusa termitida]|uniref:Uncharacterized protein n=1 Tax=Sporomusa termitida TaxID=2377 RepID=A0A517E199_9FIRM|nr:hypothetical protein [Sporomusa termitida]QDR83276.1 hypothetical protein SPTER_47580 [Sporomusa termitida]
MMGKIYDDNVNSKHGPFGQPQAQPGPYGGKDTDNLTSKKAATIISATTAATTRPKQ